MPNRETFFNDAKRIYGKQRMYNILEILKEINFEYGWINMDKTFSEWNLKKLFFLFWNDFWNLNSTFP